MKQVNHTFYHLAQNSKKILVLDLGFLGDTVHLLPALWEVRQAFPEAQLEVVVAEHIQSLMQITPWVDRVWGYPRFPKGPKWYQDFGRVRTFRKERYDLVINLGGSDRSTFLTWAIGVPLSLVRMPQRHKWYWQFFVDYAVDVPYKTRPVYRQRWECLKAAGFPGEAPLFKPEIPGAAMAKVDALVADIGSFIHISPFTTLDIKELPITLLAAFLDTLAKRYKMVISCAPNERERGKLQSLLEAIHFEPAKIFAGELSLVELCALMGKCSLHIGGDSGGLHLANMMGVPTFSWYRASEPNPEWRPAGKKHRTIFGEEDPKGLQGITLEDMLAILKELDF